MQPIPDDVATLPFARRRLFFAEQVRTPCAKNWNGSIHILGQTWHAFSWQAKEKVTLTQMVARLLRALT
jgi:hypothetical protein